MANQWFKFYGIEYLSDQKIERLNPLERSCWITLLCLASTTDDGIIEFLTVQTLLNKSGIQYDPYHPEEWESALSVLEKFQSLKMIKRLDVGTIEVLNWGKRQERTAQTPYERLKKHRQNKAKIENDNEMITGDNANDNDRIEENRIEENRIDKNTGSANAPCPLDEVKTKTSKKFERPTVEEVRAYCEERKNGIDAQAFLDSNDAKGWVTGKARTPIKDWKAVVRTWENYRKEQGTVSVTKPSSVGNVLKTEQTEEIIKHAKSKIIQA